MPFANKKYTVVTATHYPQTFALPSPQTVDVLAYILRVVNLTPMDMDGQRNGPALAYDLNLGSLGAPFQICRQYVHAVLTDLQRLNGDVGIKVPVRGQALTITKPICVDRQSQ